MPLSFVPRGELRGVGDLTTRLLGRQSAREPYRDRGPATKRVWRARDHAHPRRHAHRSCCARHRGSGGNEPTYIAELLGVLGVLGVLALPAYWLGLPSVFAGAALAIGLGGDPPRSDNSGRSIVTSTGIVLGFVTIAIAAFEAVER